MNCSMMKELWLWLLLSSLLLLPSCEACSFVFRALDGSFLREEFQVTEDPNILHSKVVKKAKCREDIGDQDVTITLDTGAVTSGLSTSVTPATPTPSDSAADGYVATVLETTIVISKDEETVVSFDLENPSGEALPEFFQAYPGSLFVDGVIAYLFYEFFTEEDGLAVAVIDLETTQVTFSVAASAVFASLLGTSALEVYPDLNIALLQGSGAACDSAYVVHYTDTSAAVVHVISSISPLSSVGSFDGTIFKFVETVSADGSAFYTMQYTFAWDSSEQCTAKDPSFSAFPAHVVRQQGYIISKKSLTTGETLGTFAINADDVAAIGHEFHDLQCFSGDVTVNVEGKGLVPMKELELYDWVETLHGRFEPVYSFGHLENDSKPREMLRFEPWGLEMTKDHMIYVQDKGFVPASNVEVNDQVNDGGMVTAIESFWASSGVYAPFTPSGKLLVNGVLASSYIWLKGVSVETLPLSGSTFIGSFQWVAHMFESPHRIWCYHLGPCPTEEYTQDGISKWVAQPMELVQRVITSDSPSFWEKLAIAGLVCVLVVANGIELVFNADPVVVLMVVMGLIVFLSFFWKQFTCEGLNM